MNERYPLPFQFRAQECIKALQPLGISHIIYGFCDNIQNIASFGLQSRRGKNFSLLPESLHQRMLQQGLNWEHCLPLEYCWQWEADFEWSNTKIWQTKPDPRQQEIHALWKTSGLNTGVSIPIRISAHQNSTIGAAVLLFARHIPENDFRAMYSHNAHNLRRHAEILDREIRRSCMQSFFPLTKSERAALQLYQRFGSVQQIARLYRISPRAVQLRLQKARQKLQVETNTEAINFCHTFQLLDNF